MWEEEGTEAGGSTLRKPHVDCGTFDFLEQTAGNSLSALLLGSMRSLAA